MAAFEIRLLGPPAILWEGSYISVPRRRARALLYRLGLDLRPVAREHLVDLFWSSTPDAVAHRDLTHLLTHLRRALPSPDILQTTNDFLFLNPTLAASDTQQFLFLFRPPRACEDPAALREALELFHGPFLDGFGLDDCPEYEEWATLERTTWEERYLSLLAALMRQSRSAGDLSLALTCAERYLALDPSDEEMGQALAHLEERTRERPRSGGRAHSQALH